MEERLTKAIGGVREENTEKKLLLQLRFHDHFYNWVYREFKLNLAKLWKVTFGSLLGLFEENCVFDTPRVALKIGSSFKSQTAKSCCNCLNTLIPKLIGHPCFLSGKILNYNPYVLRWLPFQLRLFDRLYNRVRTITVIAKKIRFTSHMLTL